jgi:exonuclease III
MTIATWNIRGINKKMPEIISELKERKIDIIVVTNSMEQSPS